MWRSTPYVCLGCGRDFGGRRRLRNHTRRGGACASPDRWAALCAEPARAGAARRCGACKEAFVGCDDYLAHFRRDPVCRLWAAAWPELHQEAQRDDPDSLSEASGGPTGFLPCPGCGALCQVWRGDELYSLGAHIAEAPSCYHALPTETQQVFLDALWNEKKTEEEYQEALTARGWA